VQYRVAEFAADTGVSGPIQRWLDMMSPSGWQLVSMVAAAADEDGKPGPIVVVLGME
jgi:hypothetical protein